MQTLDLKGLQMPVIGLGTWQLTGDGARAAVKTALECGYRHIDTAAMYGNEESVGMGLRDSGIPRGDIFLTTKVWSDDIRDGDLQKSARASLARLNTDYVDLLLIHWPNASVPLKESIKALREMQDAGVAKRIGVSNFPVALMREAVETLEAPIVCNQVEYHPYLDQSQVLDYAKKHGLVVTAYCPLARGRLADNATIANIAKKHGKTIGQVALRWLVQQGGVAAIPKSGSEKHIRENIDIFDFTLTDAEMAEIKAMAKPDGRIVQPAHAPVWDKMAA